MKILIINQFASTPHYSSGAGERFYFLLRYFEEQGISSTVISGGYNHLFKELPQCSALFNAEEVPGGKFIWVKLKKYAPESFFGRVYSWFEFLIKLFRYKIPKEERPQVVIVSSMSIIPVFYAVYLKWKYRCKFILEVRDIWPMTPVQLGGIKKGHPFIRFLRIVEKWSYRKANTLVSVLPDFSAHVNASVKNHGPVHWIPNAFEPENVDEEGKKLLLSSGFNVVYCGAMGTANALNYLVDCAQLLKDHTDIKFVFIGDGPDKEILVKRAEGSNCYFYDKVAKSEVHGIISSCDVGVISWKNKSIYQFGVSANKYNDYMYAELPILSASNIISDPAVVAQAGVQVLPESAEALKEGILKLYGMKEADRKTLGENGRRYVLSNKTYSVISKQYSELIHGLA